ncbi:porin family protein [Sulfitobacter sp. W027]|jgi:hypothetical protein|uniref:porin family protein n=1 Tax=Sulfitobacter sp. W027 TaxID=2867025 RepID=UPI0021A5434C|nr:porin family protein [Sulfitobacter sp. W027]UWR34595.1 porin family protein [Sulfitobacter sp. W027]
MKSKNFPGLTLVATLALGATTAQAVEVTGGSVGLSYSAFADDTDFSRLGLDGSVEIGINRNFGVQFDAGYSDFGFTGVDSHSLGLHGIYHLDEATSFGAFYTREEALGEDADILGVEAGYEMLEWEFEGYLANVDSDAGDGTLGGLKARYAMAEGFGLTGSFDHFGSDGDDLSRFAVRLDRDVSPTTNLFLEVGSAKVDVGGINETEPFVGLGGEIAFGADRGTTFDQRGLARLIPGL